MGNTLQLYSRYRVMDLGNRVGHYNECDKFERNDTNQLSLHTKIDSEQKWFVSLGYIIFYCMGGEKDDLYFKP